MGRRLGWRRFTAVRCHAPVATLSSHDDARLRELLRRHGQDDSLGYFALRRDKSVIWSPSGKAAIVYRRELGLTALGLGDEAILTAATFTLDGRAIRGVRQPCLRVARAGYTAQIRRTGAVRGFLDFVPWCTNGISLDLMRRDRTSDNGLNEFMIAKSMQACPAIGVDRVSLNFAVFRDALERGAQIGAGPVLRLRRRVLLIASRWWQIDTLYRFNAKFQPIWQPRFISRPAILKRSAARG